jgi:type IV secretory pathway TraG/TraD family ATPase VirD4
MDKVILAKNVILEGGLGSARPNDNQIVFGGTGSGKSMSVLIPTLCHMKNTSFIGTFAKKSIVDNAVRYFRDAGYKTYVWNLANPSSGDKVPDPLCYVSSDDEVQELARAIANSNSDYARSTHFDPFWRDSSEALLTGLIYYILMKSKNPSMKEVLDLFYKIEIHEDGRAITSSIDYIRDSLVKKTPDSVAAKKLQSFLQLPYGTAGCVLGDLQSCIQNTFTESIRNAMSKDVCVSFERFASEKTAIFLLTSPVCTVSYAFANIMFEIAISKLMKFAESRNDHRLPLDIKLMFDDFSCGFPVRNFEKSISTFRSAGISCLMLCQSLSQLNTTYGENKATTIMDNCSAIAYLPGGMNQPTANYFSKVFDVPVGDVMFMPVGNMIVFQSGKPPLITKRYETLEDPLYQKLMELNAEKEVV